ncbi:GM25748 gene product from transcript GM25748-RA [Rhizoctonia solani]|uniref:GM25748 gene product from transcript GM25748-RA n=1 Tax=Rhizoctonia solani TaxID=456999 RepID=A0A0K6G579_9AGAM|nr:GM25748 gene product from transcript GM25748-RA [Rhizoctonia solani]
MGTRGFFAYRYKRLYYRQYAPRDAHIGSYGRGQIFLGLIPHVSALQDWIEDTIEMLEDAETCEQCDHDYDDVLFLKTHRYQTTYDNDWMFVVGYSISWTYVIDLDNLAFIVNGYDYWRLDRLPANLIDYYDYDGLKDDIPEHCLCTDIDLWPPHDFDEEDCQKSYEALHPAIVPAAEWGAPTWDKLSMSQRFSIEITHNLLHELSPSLTQAYIPYIRARIGEYCWDILCASIPALPIFQDNLLEDFDLSPRTLYSGTTRDGTRPGYPNMRSFRTNQPFKIGDTRSIEYFWVRGCLVTFCTRLSEPMFVALEVTQMLRKLRRSKLPESVGIILSSQQTLVVVALDGTKVRHSPVLDIRAASDVPGGASDGRLLLTSLLNSPSHSLSLPWRTRPHQPLSRTSNPTAALPSEILQMIIHCADIDMGTYLALCRASRSIRSVCLANPQVGDYTVLRKVPDFDSIFIARGLGDNTEKTIKIWWQRSESLYHSHGKWKFQEVSPEELTELEEE